MKRSVHAKRPSSERLSLPSDTDAEKIVAGIAVDSPKGARSVDELKDSDFLDPILRQLWATAVACPIPYRFDGTRTRGIAAAAGVEFQVAEAVRSATPVLFDARGWWVRRVRDAAIRRVLMADLVDLVNALGRGAGLDDVVPKLEAALEASRWRKVLKPVERRAAA